MQLTTSKKRTGDTALSTAPWANVIRQRYGAAAEMLSRWSPTKQAYCAANFQRAATDTPAVIRMTLSYGSATMVDLLTVHISEAVMAIADADTPPVDEADIRRVAQLMVADERLRVLPLGVLLVWFNRVKSRRYKIYGKHVTPMKLLECLQQQLPSLMAEASQARQEAERKAAARASEKHAATAVDWETYSRMRGIEGQSPIEAAGQQEGCAMTARQRKAATLREVPEYIYEWVAEALTAALDADEQPLVTSFPSRDRLAVSYPLLVNRDGWSVIGSADFEVEREPGSMQPGEPTRFLRLWVMSCIRYDDSNQPMPHKFHVGKFGRYFEI